MMTPNLPPKVDLAIIGGGINGAGLAHEAARSGLSLVLFEKGDFGSGTSSKSTKLIHGGIRYLEQGRLSLVHESLSERRRLLADFPHLVHPLPFLIPCYEGDARPPWMLRIGLWLYGLLAGQGRLGRNRWLSPAEALSLAPGLRREGLKGCGLYFDAQVNDARLVLENVLAAEEAGARCLNECRVTRVEPLPRGFRVHYRSTDLTGSMETSCLVNATGPWANATDALFPGTRPKRVRPTRGSHLVVPQAIPDHAILVSAQRDGRVFFIIPWRGMSLVGTTDLDDPGDPDGVHPTQEEMDYLLEEASRVLPGGSWTRDRVQAAFAGLRPLAWTEGGSASSVSREDRIVREGRLLTLVGGKLTTYRAMALKALGSVGKVLGRRIRPVPPSIPHRTWEELLQEASVWSARYGITDTQARNLSSLYGPRAPRILEGLAADPGLREPLHPQAPDLTAQVVYAVRKEKALHLEDVMLRRLELGYGPYRWGEAPEKASRIMAGILGWDEDERQRELSRYRDLLHPPPMES